MRRAYPGNRQGGGGKGQTSVSGSSTGCRGNDGRYRSRYRRGYVRIIVAGENYEAGKITTSSEVRRCLCYGSSEGWWVGVGRWGLGVLGFGGFGVWGFGGFGVWGFGGLGVWSGAKSGGRGLGQCAVVSQRYIPLRRLCC